MCLSVIKSWSHKCQSGCGHMLSGVKEHACFDQMHPVAWFVACLYARSVLFAHIWACCSVLLCWVATATVAHCQQSPQNQTTMCTGCSSFAAAGLCALFWGLSLARTGPGSVAVTQLLVAALPCLCLWSMTLACSCLCSCFVSVAAVVRVGVAFGLQYRTHVYTPRRVPDQPNVCLIASGVVT